MYVYLLNYHSARDFICTDFILSTMIFYFVPPFLRASFWQICHMETLFPLTRCKDWFSQNTPSLLIYDEVTLRFGDGSQFERHLIFGL